MGVYTIPTIDEIKTIHYRIDPHGYYDINDLLDKLENSTSFINLYSVIRKVHYFDFKEDQYHILDSIERKYQPMFGLMISIIHKYDVETSYKEALDFYFRLRRNDKIDDILN